MLKIFLPILKLVIGHVDINSVLPSRKPLFKRETSKPKRILTHLKEYEGTHNTVNETSRKCKHLYGSGIP